MTIATTRSAAAEAQAPRWNLPLLAAVVLLLAHGVLAWLLRYPAVLTGQDDAAYLLLARALRSLEYRDLWLVGQPLEIRYPPGYPALLATWSVVARQSHDVYLAINISASVGALAVVYGALARAWRPTAAAFCLVGVVFNPWLLLIVGVLRPEASFALVTALALWLTQRDDRRWPVAVVAGTCALFAALLRLPGIAVAGAIGLHWLLQRRWRAAAALGVATIATAGAWILWTMTAPDQFIGTSYGADFAAPVTDASAPFIVELALRAWHNVTEYGARIIPALLMLPAVPDTVLDNLITGGLTVTGLIVGTTVLMRRWRAAALFLVGYGAILAAWTWQSGRYLVPLLPLLVPTVLIGVGRAAKLVWRSAELPAVAALALVMAGGGLWSTVGLVRQAAPCERGGSWPHPSCLGPEQQGYFAALRFVADSTAPEAVVHSGKPEPIYLYTGRQTVNRGAMLNALESDTAAALAPLREAGVTHVLLTHLAASDRRIFRQLERRCGDLSLVAEFRPYTYIFAVPDTGAVPTPGACPALERYGAATYDSAAGALRPFPVEWPPAGGILARFGSD